jgi:hypothetical protein
VIGFFVTRYHVACLFAAGAFWGMTLTTCTRESVAPQMAHQCEQTVLEPFLHRRPGDVTLGELRTLIRDLQRCSREDTLFTEETDEFGIGGFAGEPHDSGIYRSSP